MTVRTVAYATIAIFALLGARSARCAEEGFFRNDGQLGPAVRFHGSSGRVAWFLEREGITIVNVDPEAGRRVARVGFLEPNLAVSPVGARALTRRGNFFLGRNPARWRDSVPCFGEVVYEEVWPGIDLRILVQDGALTVSAELEPEADRSRARFRVDGDETLVHDTCRLPRPGHGGSTPVERDLREAPACVAWSTFLGGGLSDYGNTIAVRPSGNVLMAGLTTSLDYPVTPGALDSTQGGAGDVCVSELDAAGSTVIWSTYIGGVATDIAQKILLDGDGDVVLTGKTESPDFPVTSHCADETFGGVSDAFVTKLDTAGALRWSTFLGGTAYEIAFGLAADPERNIAVAGYTQSPDFPTTPGALDRSHNGGFDIFLLLLASGGDRWIWSTFFGGSNDDRAYALGRDPAGDYLLTAWTQSTDFPTTPGAYDETGNGSADVYVAKVQASGSRLIWSTLLGGAGLERAYGLAVDPDGDVLVAGVTHSQDFPTTPGAADETYNGGGDGFVAKLSEAGDALHWCTLFGGSGEDVCRDLVLDDADRPIIAGSTQSPDLPTAGAGIDPDYNGGGDFLCSMLDAGGRALLWGTYLGGASFDVANALARAAGGEILVAGESESDDFPTTPDSADPTWNGQLDVAAALLRVDAAADAPGPGAAASVRGSVALSVAPNPTGGAVEAIFVLEQPETVRLTVHSTGGALIRTLLAGCLLRVGEHRVEWEGNDQRGNRVPAGAYRLRLQIGERTVSRTSVLLR